MNLDILSPVVEWRLPVQKPRILLSFYPGILAYGFHIQDHIIVTMTVGAPAIYHILDGRVEEEREPTSGLSHPNLSGFSGSPLQHHYLIFGYTIVTCLHLATREGRNVGSLFVGFLKF